MELRWAMANRTHALILWRSEHSLLTLNDLANMAGLHPELVEKFVDYGLIEPSAGTSSRPLFSAAAVQRLRCIIRLRRDLGVNLAGVAVILEMKERIEKVQKELELLRGRS
jgi:MerR family transcriptional regulator, heat shock protein HspR